MNTNILDVKVDDHGECGFCKKQRGELVIPWETYAEWLLLMQKMGNQEFGAVFDVVNGIVGNVRYPEQEISSASVTFTEELGGNGVMHSHHSMGSFHSHQDDTQFRNLAEYSVVLSHSGALGTKRVTLPCGGFGHVPLDIKLEGKEPVNLRFSKPQVTENVFTKREAAIESYASWREYQEETFRAWEDGKAKETSTATDDEDVDVYECHACHHVFFAEAWEACPRCGDVRTYRAMTYEEYKNFMAE